jgi:serine phosphatase RsbU (regulator of sigma subunit)
LRLIHTRDASARGWPGIRILVGMSGQNESDSEELRRLQAELASREDEVEQLRVAAASAEREIIDLRHLARQESEQIDRLQEDAVASQRIERAQRALIAELRAEVGEEARAELELGARLRAAELELVDLRAIRDALLPPTLVQREGMSIAAEVIPAERYVGGDFFFVGDGPRGTVVAAVGDVVGKGLGAARRSAFTRTALASVAAFSDDPCRLLQWVNVALVERIGESAEFVTAACVTYDPGTRVLRFASAGIPPRCAWSPATSSRQRGPAWHSVWHYRSIVGRVRSGSERVTACFSTPTGWSKRAGSGAATARTD